MTTLILSVGTSLLVNARKDLHPAPAKAKKDATPALLTVEDLVAWLRTQDLTRASAETHTLLRLPVQAGDRLAWLHSDTPDGVHCADALHQYYGQQGYASTLHRIAGLNNNNEAAFVEHGLRALVSTAMAVMAQAGGPANVRILATGGFKAEIAYLNLIGILNNVEVVYLHELFHQVVVLPRLPLDWHTDWVDEHRDFFQALNSKTGLPPASVEEYIARHAGLPTMPPLLVNEAGHMRLSAAGIALYQAYLGRLAR